MKMKINEMEIDITRQENFPEEHFGRFIEIMEEYLKCKENIRTAKEIKELKLPSLKARGSYVQKNIIYTSKEYILNSYSIRILLTRVATNSLTIA